MKKLWKKWGPGIAGLGIIFLVILALSYFMYVQKIRPQSERHGTETVIAVCDNDLEIQDRKVLEQEFTSEEENIAGIAIKLNQYQNQNQGFISFQMVDLDNPKMTTEVLKLDVSNIISQKFLDVVFNDFLEGVKGHRCKLIITLELETGPDNQLGFYVGEWEQKDAVLKIDGKESTEDIGFGILVPESNGFLKTGYLVVLFIVCLLVVALYYLLFIRKVKVETAFLIVAFSVGILYMFLMKPNAVPDELAHYSCSAARSNQMLGKEDLTGIGNNEYIQTPTAVEAYRDIHTKFFEKGSRADYDKAWDDLDNAPFYLHTITGLGITIARLLNLSVVAAFYLGRFLNLAFFVLCTYFGMKKLPFGKMAMFALALFPMTIHLAASFSYDAIINGMCFFFVSYCIYLAFDKEKVSVNWKDIIVLCIWGMLICGSKGGAYIPVCLTVFLIPRNKLGNTKKKVQKLAAVAGSWGIWYLLMNYAVMQNSAGQSVSYIERTGETGFTLGMLIEHPVNSVIMLINTAWQMIDTWFMNLIGKKLGWVNVETLDVLVIGFLVIFLLGVLTVETKESKLIPSWKKIMLTSAILVSAGMTIMAMWLNWTPVSYTFIDGVQGRYFLPLIPMLIVILKNDTIVLKRNLDRQLAYSVFLLQIPTMLKVFDSLVIN